MVKWVGGGVSQAFVLKPTVKKNVQFFSQLLIGLKCWGEGSCSLVMAFRPFHTDVGSVTGKAVFFSFSV